MTEREWLVCKEVDEMLEFIRATASDRKLRLFICGCCRRMSPWLKRRPQILRICEKAVNAGERFADGLIDLKTLDQAISDRERAAGNTGPFILAILAVSDALNRSIISGRPMKFGRNVIGHPASSGAAAARGAAMCIARDYYKGAGKPSSEARRVTLAEKQAQTLMLRDLFGNPFLPLPTKQELRPWTMSESSRIRELATSIYRKHEFECLPRLADILEEEGCTREILLEHFRSEGPHVRGCWALDLILGKPHP